jgi:hypothetical protein
MLPRRRLLLQDRIMLAWVVAGAAPAIFSDRAYPKRAATLYPALFVIAAAAGARFVELLRSSPRAARLAFGGFATVSVLAWFCATAALWFSGNRVVYGKPGEGVLAERLAPHLTPGTIVIADIWENYTRSKLSYLLNDTLTSPQRQPLFWYIVEPDRDLRSFIDDPTLALPYSDPDAFYNRWSAIGHARTAALPQREWRQVIFLFQSIADSPAALALVRTGLPFANSDRARIEMVRQRDPACAIEVAPPDNCNDCGFVIARCPLRPIS